MIHPRLEIVQIETRKVCTGGIGKLFYQAGFPISMSISQLKKIGVEVSILHVADECMKNGWTAKTTYNKLIADFEDDIDGNIVDTEQLKKFCYASWDDQREMIYNYLFVTPETARDFFNEILQPTNP